MMCRMISIYTIITANDPVAFHLVRSCAAELVLVLHRHIFYTDQYQNLVKYTILVSVLKIKLSYRLVCRNMPSHVP